jgi:hypothetical protein
MPLQIDGAFVVRSYWENVDLIAVLNLETAKLFRNRIRIALRRKVDVEHRAFFVGFQALDFNVLKRGGGQDSASKV